MFDFLTGLNTYEIIGNCISFAASIFMILSFQIKSLKKLLALQAVLAMMYGVAFIFLGAYQGVALNFISAFTRLVSIFREKRWAASRIWMFVFAGMYLACALLFVGEEGWQSLLPAAAMILYVFVLRLNNPLIFKINHLCTTSPSWLVYNLYAKNYPGVATEIFNIVSIAISLIRMYIEKRKRARVSE